MGNAAYMLQSFMENFDKKERPSLLRREVSHDFGGVSNCLTVSEQG